MERAKEILREHHRQSNRLREHYGTTSEDQIKVNKETIEHLKSLGYIR